MDRTAIATAALVCLVLVAGCSGTPGSAADTATDDETPSGTTSPDTSTATRTGTPETTATPTATADPTASSTPTAGSTPTASSTPTAGSTPTASSTPTAAPTATPSESWSPAEHPNKPLENKLEQEDLSNRVKHVEVTGGTESGDGYSAVEVSVTANTSMYGIDPASHGTTEGEPFFILYIDSPLVNESDSRFSHVDGPPIQRKSVPFEGNGTFTLDVPQAAFEARGTDPGEAELMVVLFDEDEAWDDIYGVGRTTVTYSPGE